ncbi:MAG TPA: 50S ribosomal protein L14e [Candidatus Nanoarchaeia archaeon]|nr:50S ribosomal protein L14e [Candidatus Nanoarchaeia archaeon]
MAEIGRLYVKIAGREAGKFCTVVDTIENQFVMIDGQVRRKKCNLMHLEPLEKTVDLKKGASHTDVVKAFEKLGIKIVTTKAKTKKGAKPVAQRKKKKQKLLKRSQRKQQRRSQQKRKLRNKQ